MVEELDGGLWVAATERGRLQGLEADPGIERVRWGAIYWGKVSRIDKAMDAAFIDLGEGNEGILITRMSGFRARIVQSSRAVRRP